MPNPAHEFDQTPGQDSFLDIIANIVGILIILVLVVGIRVQKLPPAQSGVDAELGALSARLQELSNDLGARRADLAELARQVANLEFQAQLQEAVRDRLAAAVAWMNRQLSEARARLDHDRQAGYSLQVRINQLRRVIRELEAEKEHFLSSPPQVTVIEHRPSPLARVVEGNEIHFQLRQNRVAYIPLESLIERVKQRVREESPRLITQPEWTDTVGPEGGYHLRFLLRRYDATVETSPTTRQTASFVRVEYWELIPSTPELGEPIEEALRPESKFHQILARQPPGRTTVTLWTYPESFSAYRRLRDRIHELGFTCAARPLPTGVLIAGSPHGSRSVAQ